MLKSLATKHNSSKPSVRRSALDLLAQREHSRSELSRKLTLRDFLFEEIEICLTALEKEGLLSDARFTEAYIKMRARKGFGPVRIMQELQERGVEKTIAREMMYSDELNWYDLATEARRKKFGTGLASDYATKAAYMRFLQYRGFSREQINAAIGDFDEV